MKRRIFICFILKPQNANNFLSNPFWGYFKLYYGLFHLTKYLTYEHQFSDIKNDSTIKLTY